MITDYLFSFPIIMIDGGKQEKESEISRLINKEVNDEPELVYGEAMCHFEDFLSIVDRWLPTGRSYNNALNGRFDACEVTFSQSGQFLVPLKKSEFLTKLNNFLVSVEKLTIKID